MDANIKNQNSNEKHDPSFCNLLLAQYEKSRAIENIENIDTIINSKESKQFLDTFGDEVIERISEETKIKEREMQLLYDMKMVEILKKPASAGLMLKAFYNVVSERVYFDYINSVRALKNLESAAQKTREENAMLQKELDSLLVDIGEAPPFGSIEGK